MNKVEQMSFRSAAGPDYSVVIPFYNEESTVALLLGEVLTVMQSITPDFELLMVNDGSVDDTGNLLAEVASKDPRCRVITMAGNRGQAAALFCGIRRAVAPVVITLDGDGQNDPRDIPAMLARMAEDAADMIVGWRAVRKDSALRRHMSRVGNAVRRGILHDGVSDSGCALKAFKREVADSFIPIRTLYSFMPSMAVAAGFKVVQMPVNHRARAGGVAKYGLRVFLWRPFVDLLGMWWFRTRCIREAHVVPAVRAGRGNRP